ncbi:MAG: hypothetical protein PHO41_11720 [Eubacteriales bacterium]|nr:hypothetical protein [Eubacteriales bacterium]
MQQTLNPSWWEKARMNGILRYHFKTLSRLVLWTLLIMLVSQTLSFLAPLIFNMDYAFSNLYPDLSITLIVSLIGGVIVAGRSTRFLTRFGTARLPIWLGNLLGLFAAMVALLLSTLLLSMLAGALVMLLGQSMPTRYVFQESVDQYQGAALYWQTVLIALEALPEYILYTLEWTSIFYLLGCCLRRNRGITLLVVIGGPLLLMSLTFIPAVRETVRVVENASDTQIMLMGAQWMRYVMDVLKFIDSQWLTIQLVAGLISLPLSYLCMRETPQP